MLNALLGCDAEEAPGAPALATSTQGSAFAQGWERDMRAYLER
jgi:hypothetical protein